MNTPSSSTTATTSTAITTATPLHERQTLTTTTPSMNPNIWRNLPHPLLDRILAFLPPPSFFRSLTLSKRVYSLLFSTSFLNLHLRLTSTYSLHPSFFFFSNSNPNNNFTLFLYTPTSNSWHCIPLPNLPHNFTPYASSNGLLLLASNPPGPKQVILLNPLTKLFTQLPLSPTPRLLPSIGLSVTNTSLTVVLAGDDMISAYAVKNLSSEAFYVNGASGLYSPWGIVSALPRLCSIEPNNMVFLNGKFYCMSCSPHSVMVYDVGTNVWSERKAPMDRFIRSPSLVTLNGRKLLMVAMVEKKKLSVPRSLRVWEMMEEEEEGGKRVWDKVEKMPMEIYGEFEEKEGGKGFECVGSGDYIVVIVKGSSGTMLLYDFRRKIWEWVRHCPFVCDGGFRGFGYEPRLATPALGLVDEATMAI